MRKKTELKKEVEKAVERLKEIETLVKEAEIEETERLESVRQQIHKICEANGLYCGLVLDSESLANIVKFAIDNKENTKIPFNLYFND